MMICGFVAMLALAGGAGPRETLAQRNEALLRELQQVHGLSDESMARIRAVGSVKPGRRSHTTHRGDGSGQVVHG